MKTIQPEISTKEGLEPKMPTTFWQHIKNHRTLSVLLLSIVVIAAVIIWKNAQNEKQKLVIMTQATFQIETIQNDLLKIIAKPLVWYIRSEMLRGNMEQVEILIADIVKEKNFRYIHIVQPDGIVLLSTNKSFESKAIGSTIIPQMLLEDSTSIVVSADKIIMVSTPIMGVDKRLATLIMGYQNSTIKLN